MKKNFLAQLRSPLCVLLLVGLVQGLLYTFLIPPWWHYDEPGHFEFAWQIVHFDHWPHHGEFDETMRRELARSLVRYEYYKPLEYRPDFSSNEPVFIGVAPQSTDYPLYYLIASLPLRFLGKTDFAFQNRAMRLVSLGMFLLTIWVTWKSLTELLPEEHPIRWMTTLFVALLPGLTDTMTSINDDVGAVLAFSLFVWAALRIMRRCFSWRRLLILGTTLIICYFTKTTAWPAFVAAPFALLFSLLRGRRRWLAWGISLATLIMVSIFTLRWGDARFWYRLGIQNESTRSHRMDAPVGEYVFHLHYSEGETPWIGQFIGVKQMRPLRGKSVTLGAWIWANRPVTIRFPVLRMTTYEGTVAYSPSKTITLNTIPTFYAFTFDVPAEAEYGWLKFPPLSSEEEAHVYYDGVVLVDGIRIGIPRFNNPSAQSGEWDGQPFQNRLRGASAESAWLYLNPSLQRILKETNKAPIISFQIFLASVQDWRSQEAYYRGTAVTLFRTFWAQPARNKISILGENNSYKIIQWLSVFGISGAIFLLLRKRDVVPWAEVTVLGFAMVGIWGMTVARGGGGVLSRSPITPWARYAFPAIIPTALLLCSGWWEVMRWSTQTLNLSPKQPAIFFIVVLLVWDFFALLSVARYFYWDKYPELEYALLMLLVTFLAYLSLSSRADTLQNMMNPRAE